MGRPARNSGGPDTVSSTCTDTAAFWNTFEDPEPLPVPCALVSQREASAVFGAPATSGQPFATTSCSWIVARKPGEPAPAPGAVTYVLSAASYDIRPYTSHKPPIDPFALIPRDEVLSPHHPARHR